MKFTTLFLPTTLLLVNLINGQFQFSCQVVESFLGYSPMDPVTNLIKYTLKFNGEVNQFYLNVASEAAACLKSKLVDERADRSVVSITLPKTVGDKLKDLSKDLDTGLTIDEETIPTYKDKVEEPKYKGKDNKPKGMDKPVEKKL